MTNTIPKHRKTNINYGNNMPKYKSNHETQYSKDNNMNCAKKIEKRELF
jgi:hypothetical protein